MKAPSFRFRYVGLALLIGVGSSAADTPSVENLDQAVLSVVEQQPVDGAPAGATRIEQPERVRRELGAVVDGRPEDAGLPRVMAITPGRAADRMGLQVGDRLLKLGDQEMRSVGDPTAALREAVDGAEGQLTLTIERGSEQLTLTGYPDEVRLPAYRIEIEPLADRGCGRVSVVGLPPRSRGFYRALLHEIDGRLPGPLDSEVFRVSAGRHVLKVSELVDGTRFSGTQERKRGQLFRHERFKYLVLDVKPNTTYRLGLQFYKERLDPINEQAYWEPVIWEERNETCH